MDKKHLMNYKIKINSLSKEEQQLRDRYLSDLSTGELQGPPTGYASIDKPWFRFYNKENVGKDLEFKKIDKYLFDCNKGHLDDIALVYFKKEITFKELREKIDKYASYFYNTGIKEGDIVSVLMPTTPECVYVFYALRVIGAIPDMIDPRANPETLNFYFKENKSKYMYVLDDCAPKLERAMEGTDIKNIILGKVSTEMPSMTKFVYEKFLHKNKKKNKKIYEELKKDYKVIDLINEIDNYEMKPFVEAEYKKGELALIEHSSGTTSTPKGIKLTSDNINAIAFQYNLSNLEIKRQDKFLSCIPAFAAFGMIANVHLPLSLGLKTIIIPDPSGDNIEKAFLEYQPQHILTVVSNLEKVAKSKKIKDLSYFISPGCGGYELLPSKRNEIENLFREKGCNKKILTGWGASEVSSTTCLESPNCVKDLSSGVPLAQNVVSVFDKDTNEELNYLEESEGDLYISGPTVMIGYLNNDKLTEKSIFVDEAGTRWYKTGDTGYLDKDGRVFVKGRDDRMIIIGHNGKKVCPLPIEEVINSVPEVECCIVVKADSNLGIVPKAFIVLKDAEANQAVVLNKIMDACLEKLDKKVIPEDFEFIDSMPMTPMDKINYKKLENTKIQKKLVLRNFD